jgi:hypothetical protein
LKRITHCQNELLHIEISGAEVNIRPGLISGEGREVTVVKVLCNQSVDEKWRIDDPQGQRSAILRLVKDQKPYSDRNA